MLQAAARAAASTLAAAKATLVVLITPHGFASDRDWSVPPPAFQRGVGVAADSVWLASRRGTALRKNGVRQEEHGTCLAPVPACPTLRQIQLLEIQIEQLEFRAAGMNLQLGCFMHVKNVLTFLCTF